MTGSDNPGASLRGLRVSVGEHGVVDDEVREGGASSLDISRGQSSGAGDADCRGLLGPRLLRALCPNTQVALARMHLWQGAEGSWLEEDTHLSLLDRQRSQDERIDCSGLCGLNMVSYQTRACEEAIAKNNAGRLGRDQRDTQMLSSTEYAR